MFAIKVEKVSMSHGNVLRASRNTYFWIFHIVTKNKVQIQIKKKKLKYKLEIEK